MGDDDDPLTRLDPDVAAAARRAPAPDPDPGSADRGSGSGSGDPSPVAPRPSVVDVRGYRWAIGIIGIAVILGVSIVQFATHHAGTTGVPAGRRLHWFAAPLASSDLDGDSNLHPTCSLADHDPRALNLCIDARRSAVVVSFFVAQSAACVRQVDALQSLSDRFPPARVQFLAVAVGASHARAAALVRTHRWTIPVAYDADGAVGDLYGVVVCPFAELARRGGVVTDRLIGGGWQTGRSLAPRVAALVAGSR